MGTSEIPEPRRGTPDDLVKRMERIELRQDDQGRQITSLTSTIDRVELNQKNAEVVNGLHFDALKTGLGQVSVDFKEFSGYIRGLMSGDVQNNQTREGQELVTEYRKWQTTINDKMSKLDLIGRVIWVAIIGNLVAIAGLVWSITH